MIPLRLRRIYDNPLIVKDGLSRVRSWRAPMVIALYLAVLSLFACLVFAYKLGSYRPMGGYASLGGAVFGALALMQLALVCLFAPAVTAGAISGERERQTLDVLVISRMTPLRIVWGKLVSSVAFMFLLLVAALPLFATVFLFGGVDLRQFAIAQGLTLVTMLAAAAVTLFFSTLFARTLVATVVAYGFVFVATAGSWLVGTLLNQIAIEQASMTGAAPSSLNPILTLNPIQVMTTTLQAGGPLFALTVIHPQAIAVSGPGMPATSIGATTSPALEPWLATILIELAVMALGVAGAVLMLRRRRG
jgi:ABC-2 type transport system permease protein